jgi:hypothetical protein
MPEFFPLAERDLLNSPAPVKSLLPPSITVIGDSETNDLRMLRLRVVSPRGAPMLEIISDEETQVVSVLVNGRDLDPDKNRLELRYHGLPKDGIELLIMAVKAPKPMGITVADYSPFAQSTDITVPERPAGLMTAPSPLLWQQDTVAVSKSYTF